MSETTDLMDDWLDTFSSHEYCTQHNEFWPEHDEWGCPVCAYEHEFGKPSAE